MAKAKTVYFCSECGGESVRWMGKCPHCGAWNTLVEEKVAEEPKSALPDTTISRLNSLTSACSTTFRMGARS